MALEKTLFVCILGFSDGVGEPLKLLLTTSDPDEVHLEGETLWSQDSTQAHVVNLQLTLWHWIRAPMLKRWTNSFKIEANGVTPIPPPTSIATS